MASTTREEPASLPTAANASAVAMDAKLMVATGRGDCQQLKDLLNKQDATKMVMVMTSSNQTSAAEPPPAVINPLLLASACSGYWEGLNFLLNREDAADLELPFMIESQRFRYLLAAYISGNSSNGSLAMQQASDDIEALLKQTAPSAESLLKGVTVEGDTALHAVATYGDEDDFLISADIAFSKKIDLLFVQNNKGDTPLHCAARAGNSRMVSELIGLAKGKDSSVNRVKELLETENMLKETALHEAVRIGNNDMVKLLMEEDSELASFPKDGTSPLYLAILLEKEIIAEKLYNMSLGELSYSGPNGQNALHAAVIRGTERKPAAWNSTTLALICLSLATLGIIYSEISMVNLSVRSKDSTVYMFFFSSSVTSMVAAFALGVYMVLAPVDPKTGVAICGISPSVVLYRNVERFQKLYALVGPLYIRMGVRALLSLTKDILTGTLLEFWPSILILSWAAYTSFYRR